MTRDVTADLDQLFQSTNDVLFAEGFVEDVASIELPSTQSVRSAIAPITAAAAAVVYQWTQQELQFFYGSSRHVLGAEAKKTEISGCWVVTVELVQLLSHGISVFFFFDESAQIVRVLAAMPATWLKNPMLYRTKLIMAEQRLASLVKAEVADYDKRERQLAKAAV